MIKTIRDTTESLTDVMEEETLLLGKGEWPIDIVALVAAKHRLIGNLEAALAEQQRQQPDWQAQLREDESTPLAAAFARLESAAKANAAMLKRQMLLSEELLGEVAKEVRRLSGSRQQTYGEEGRISSIEGASPVSINTRL